jgi:hypothetical protein
MTYKITKTIEQSDTALVQVVQTSTLHNAVDFENNGYTQIDKFRFESGSIELEDGAKIEITRLLMTCDKDHDHGVYYQAPRKQTLWETMFAVGETPEDTSVLSDLDKDK